MHLTLLCLPFSSWDHQIACEDSNVDVIFWSFVIDIPIVFTIIIYYFFIVIIFNQKMNIMLKINR